MKHPHIRLFDTHAHPQFSQYDEDREAVVSTALENGIGMFCVGTDVDSSRRAIKLSERYDGVFATVGIHPNDVVGVPVNVEELKELAMHRKVVAVGETGLDFYRTERKASQRIQQEHFFDHMRIADTLDLPLIIHCRQAHEEMLGLLEEELRRPTLTRLPRGVIHSFTGTAEHANRYIELGFALGLNGIVTFSQEYEEMVRSLPPHSFLLETDAPYLAPAPYRGKRNEPLYVLEVARMVANMRGENTEAILTYSLNNTLTTFSKVYVL